MKLKLTIHARKRARQMGIPARMVRNILEADDLINYPSYRGENYRVAVAGELAVPYSLDGYAITVLWRGEHGRELPRLRVRLGEGRRRGTPPSDPQARMADCARGVHHARVWTPTGQDHADIASRDPYDACSW